MFEASIVTAPLVEHCKGPAKIQRTRAVLGDSVISLLEVLGQTYSLAVLGPCRQSPRAAEVPEEDLGGRDPSW